MWAPGGPGTFAGRPRLLAAILNGAGRPLPRTTRAMTSSPPTLSRSPSLTAARFQRFATTALNWIGTTSVPAFAPAGARSAIVTRLLLPGRTGVPAPRIATSQPAGVASGTAANHTASWHARETRRITVESCSAGAFPATSRCVWNANADEITLSLASASRGACSAIASPVESSPCDRHDVPTIAPAPGASIGIFTRPAMAPRGRAARPQSSATTYGWLTRSTAEPPRTTAEPLFTTPNRRNSGTPFSGGTGSSRERLSGPRVTPVAVKTGVEDRREKRPAVWPATSANGAARFGTVAGL